MKLTWIIMYSIIFISCPVYSYTLTVPDTEKVLLSRLSESCPGCPEKGFSPSGTSAVGYGKKFYDHFYTGDPESGFLLTFVMTGDMFKKNLKENEYEKAVTALKDKFGDIELLMVSKESLSVYNLGKPEQTNVKLSEKLHRCLYQTDFPLCCCCTESCQTECCEKSLGSTGVEMIWQDPVIPGRRIIYIYSPHSGVSLIWKTDDSGKRFDVRWVLDSEGPSFLK